MKILVTGAKGMLGQEILKLNNNIIGVDINDFNILDIFNMRNYINNNKPEVIIHCAAFTEVDKAELDRNLALNINGLAVRYLVDICNDNNIKLVFISTDYVFDGTKNSPYLETDIPKPINWYGMSKYIGEQFMSYCRKGYIVRTSWLFGKYGNNFIEKILNKINVNDSINVVNDQIGSPTYAKDLAVFLLKLIETEYYGIYHATNEGYCSWYSFAKEILKIYNINKAAIPVTSDCIDNIAPRPKNSILSKCNMYKHFGKFQTWQEALKEYKMNL